MWFPFIFPRVFYFPALLAITVVDVSAQSCTITPTSPDDLDPTGGVLDNGTVNVTIECRCVDGNGDPPAKVRWFDPNMNRVPGGRNAVPGDPYSDNDNANGHSTLIISTFSGSTSGLYTCGDNNEYAAITTMPTINLLLVTPPLITMHPVGDTISLLTNNFNFSLSCEADGATSYNWERQSGSIPSGATGVNTNTLTIINLTPEDAGNYRCVATNASGSSESNYANLTINVIPPNVIQQPMDTMVPVTTVAVFTCIGQGFGDVIVAWEKLRRNRAHPISENATFDIITEPDRVTSTLTIPNVVHDDGGRYRCVFNNSEGETNSEYARLTIGIPPPVIMSHPMNITIDNGSDVTFNCVSFSYAPVSFTWERNDSVVNNVNEKTVITDSDDSTNTYSTTLMILNVQSVDDDEYVCIATNEEGFVLSYIAILSVIVPPTITQHPSSVIINEKGSTSLSCDATSNVLNVTITFTWEKFDNTTNSWGPATGTLSGIDTMMIRFSNIQQDHEGMYRCIPSNSAGNTSSNPANVTVYGPPKIVSLPHNVTVVEGSSVDIVCDVTNDHDAVGTQNVTILWFGNDGSRVYEDDRITITNSSNDNYQLSYISTLTINPVFRQDDGQYTCQALNHIVLRDSQNINLIVEFVPIVTITAVGQINQSAVNVTVNKELDIMCDVESHPPAQVHWRENGVSVDGSSGEVTRLKVTANSAIRGAIITYTCVAENVVGGNNHSVSNNITVYVQAIPDVIPGDDIKQINNTVTTIVVEWPVPNYYHAPITKYQLVLCQKTNIDDCTGSISLTVDASGSDTTVRYNITGLTPFTVYQLNISAVNEIGSSLFSSQVPIRTVNAMEAAVQGLDVTAYNNSEVTVTWMIPEYFELQDFVVMYFFKPEQAAMTIVDRPPHQLSDLIAGETYTVKVTSRYLNGVSDMTVKADTTEDTVTLKEIEPIPPVVDELMPISDDNPFGPVTLSWTKPVLTDDNKEFFSGYNVTTTRIVLEPMLGSRKKRIVDIPQSDDQTVTLDPDATSYTYSIPCPYMTDVTLCPYSQYCFTIVSVFTFNDVFIDASIPTPMCIGNTAEAAPSGPPQKLRNPSTRIHEIEIDWKFPQFPNGIITHFTMYNNGSDQRVEPSDCNINTLSCSYTISNLDPYTIYVIDVSSSTAIGEGPHSDSIVIRTDISKPKVIQDIDQSVRYSRIISFITSDSISVDVPEFSGEEGEISHYFIVVINVSETSNLSPDSISDDELGPHNGPGPHYVAAVLLPDQYDPDNPYQLSSNRTTTFEGISYRDVPLTVGMYHYFVRAYTIGPRLSCSSSTHAVFVLSDAPYITTHPTDTSAAAPFSAVFTCSASGYGDLNIIWYRNNLPLPVKAHSIKVDQSDYTTASRLTIPNVDKQDVGEYYCIVWANKKASRSRSAKLLIAGIPSLPIIFDPLINLTINNYNFSMKCGTGSGKFNYTWEKKSGKIPLRAKGVDSSHLTIFNLRPEDTGEYRCTISNSTGRITSYYTKLIVTVSPPKISKHPSTMNVSVFGSITFECTAEGFGMIEVTWQRVGCSLPITATITNITSINEVTSILRITKSSGYYSGQYYCTARNNAGTVKSQQASLHVEVPCPEMIKPPVNITVLPGQTVHYYCLASSFGLLAYDWKKYNGSVASPIPNATMTYDHVNIFGGTTAVHNLTIPNVSPSDEGEYCCIATNECGSVMKCAWLNVYTIPNITKQPTSTTVRVNSTLQTVTHCNAIGIGPLHYQWEKYQSSNDKWIRPSHRAVNIKSQKLTFSIITEDDEGIYHCVVSNNDGSVLSDNVTITVYGPPTGTITKDTVILEGSKVNLMCNATNDIDAPYPVQVNWYKGNQPLRPDGRRVQIHPKLNTTNNSLLLFDLVRRIDDGDYTCRVSNHYLSHTDLNTNLIVEYGPEVTIDPSSPQIVSVNGLLQLTCTVSGVPTPSIQWKNGSLVVANKPLYNVPTTFPHTTVYTCVGTNNAGNIQRTAGNSITVNVVSGCHPSLEAPVNGKKRIIEDGKYISFSCNSGYSLTGETLAECEDGKWSAATPVCTKTD